MFLVEVKKGGLTIIIVIKKMKNYQIFLFYSNQIACNTYKKIKPW
jgi:hypothetical protein